MQTNFYFKSKRFEGQKSLFLSSFNGLPEVGSAWSRGEGGKEALARQSGVMDI